VSRRFLTPEDEALWEQVTRGVTPLGARPQAPVPQQIRVHVRHPAQAQTLERATRAAVGAESLDRSWDRRLGSGKAEPERVIDLHGLSRAQAHALLCRQIVSAHRRGERLLLVITGKGGTPGPEPADLMPGAGPAPGGTARGGLRGSIRAELPRWLAEPDLSARIAAVRVAHPRHGGSGAVYLVLRRHRPHHQG
jgi:DNA-nicking Smr family endonuclease